LDRDKENPPAVDVEDALDGHDGENAREEPREKGVRPPVTEDSLESVIEVAGAVDVVGSIEITLCPLGTWTADNPDGRQRLPLGDTW